MAGEPSPDIMAVRQHLMTYMGTPSDVVQISGNTQPNSQISALEIGVFAPGGAAAPVVFCSCGISAIRQENGLRLEAVMVARGLDAQKAQAIYGVIGAFALFTESSGKPVGVGDVIRSPEQVRAFSDMDALVLLPPAPFVQEFHTISREDGERADYVWLLPAYDAEADYLLEHGAQALMMIFAAQGLDLTYLTRDEANTLISPEDAVELARMRETEDATKPAPTEAVPNPAPRAPGSGPAIDPAALAAFRETAAPTFQRRVKSSESRKPRRVAPPPQPEYFPEPEPEPEPSPAERNRARRAQPGARKKKKKVVRFDLPPERRRSVVPEPEPEPEEQEPELSPEEKKRKRIAELRAQAKKRSAAAKKQQEE